MHRFCRTTFTVLLSSVTLVLLDLSYGNAAPGDPKTPRLIFLDDFNVPTDTPFESVRTGTQFSDRQNRTSREIGARDGIAQRRTSGRFGGISAIKYDASQGLLFALTDSAIPTLFVFRMSIDGGKLKLLPERQILFCDQNGVPMSKWSMAPEGLALSPRNSFLVASEGYVNGNSRLGIQPTNPALYEFDRSGRLLDSIVIPKKTLGLNDDVTGMYRNRGFESITVSPDGKRMFFAAEGTLKQDGPKPSLQNGSRIRIFEFKFESELFTPQREYVYELDPPPTPPGFRNPEGSRGLSELLAISEHELLALERSFLRESPTVTGQRRSDQRVEIYLVELTSAADVTALTSLQQTDPNKHRPAKKTLLLDLRDVVPNLQTGYQSLDNFEGMCFGPRLEDGSRTVLLVSDDNFNLSQRTAFLLFKLIAD